MNDSQFFPPQEPNFPPNSWSVKNEEDTSTFPAIDFDDLSTNFDDVIMTSPLDQDLLSFSTLSPDNFYHDNGLNLDLPLDHDLNFGQSSNFQSVFSAEPEKVFDPARSSLRELIESNVKSEKKPFDFKSMLTDQKMEKSLFEYSGDQKGIFCLFKHHIPPMFPDFKIL